MKDSIALETASKNEIRLINRSLVADEPENDGPVGFCAENVKCNGENAGSLSSLTKKPPTCSGFFHTACSLLFKSRWDSAILHGLVSRRQVYPGSKCGKL